MGIFVPCLADQVGISVAQREPLLHIVQGQIIQAHGQVSCHLATALFGKFPVFGHQVSMKAGAFLSLLLASMDLRLWQRLHICLRVAQLTPTPLSWPNPFLLPTEELVLGRAGCRAILGDRIALRGRFSK